MNLKRPKQDVVDRAWMAAHSTLCNQLNPIGYYGANYDPSSTMFMLQNAMSQAIREAIQSVVDDIYTGEEFERDLGLK